MKLKTYLLAGYGALYCVSYEEDRITAQIADTAKSMKYDAWSWTVTEGLINSKGTKLKDTADPLKALTAFIEYNIQDNVPHGTHVPNKSLVIFKDLHMFLKSANPVLVRRMKEAITIGRATNRHIIILGPVLHLPVELEKEITVLEFQLPTRDELKEVAVTVAKAAKQELNGNTEAILDAMSGLTLNEAADAAAFSKVEAGEIDAEVVGRIKADTIKKNGIVELVNTDIALSSIGGLDVIKTWLSKRKAAFGKQAKIYGLPTPKGFLAIGLAGCGKSMIGKATANVLGVPLLKLDGGKIFGSLVGASEQNMRTAISTAEAIAPCVLMVDELEKAMSGSKSSGQTDGGTSSRVLGTFLQWMQDKTAPVFVVATANDISQLPPELLRRGRFDQLFFVDLPDAQERKSIWEIHIRKTKREPSQFDLDRLSSITAGFTGAEIESVVTDALFSAFDIGVEPSMDSFTDAVSRTIPLSKTMHEQIEAMRQWADGRAIRASSNHDCKPVALTRLIA